jgi:hypothetical protein
MTAVLVVLGTWTLIAIAVALTPAIRARLAVAGIDREYRALCT